MLSSDKYFEDMINQNTNEYEPFNTTNGIPYDMAKTELYSPLLRKQKVDKEVDKEVEVANREVAAEVANEEVAAEVATEVAVANREDCTTTDKYYKSTNGTNYWAAKVFPKKHLTDKLVFKNNQPCSFGPLIYIMKQYEGKEYSIDELKDNIWNAYSDYLPNYKNQILSLLKNQGKTQILKKYNNHLKDLIKSEDYFLTSLDVWVFAEKYRVPIILFSSTNTINDVLIIQDNMPGIQKNKENYRIDKPAVNKNSDFKYSWIVLGGGKEDKFFFYLSSPVYRGAHINNNEIIVESFYKTDLGEFQQQLEYGVEQKIPFEDFLKARP